MKTVLWSNGRILPVSFMDATDPEPTAKVSTMKPIQIIRNSSCSCTSSGGWESSTRPMMLRSAGASSGRCR
ncbi:hypothetical protein D3C73_1565120 [compost metagenome]